MTYAGVIMGMSLAYARHFEHCAVTIRDGANAVLRVRPELRDQYERAVWKGINGR